jgi:hypothetical protein
VQSLVKFPERGTLLSSYAYGIHKSYSEVQLSMQEFTSYFGVIGNRNVKVQSGPECRQFHIGPLGDEKWSQISTFSTEIFRCIFMLSLESVYNTNLKYSKDH